MVKNLEQFLVYGGSPERQYLPNNELIGRTVYVHKEYGQYSPKCGQSCCHKKVITEAFNIGYGNSYVKMDDTGNTYRLVLDGVASNYTAHLVDGRLKLDLGLSFEPYGDVLTDCPMERSK
jgi:hypothetical protein